MKQSVADSPVKRTWIIKIIISIYTILIILSIISFLLSFSTTRKYYTFAQIEKYVDKVFGKDFSFIETSFKNQYVYEDANGIQFTVEAISYPVVSFYTDHLPIYRKAVKDNYTEAVINYYKDDIKKIAEKNDLDAVSSSYNINVIIENKQQSEKAAEVIAEIDNLLNININYSKGRLRKYKKKYDNSNKINLYLKPENTDENLTYKNKICEFKISFDDNKRLTAKKTLKIIKLNL